MKHVQATLEEDARGLVKVDVDESDRPEAGDRPQQSPRDCLSHRHFPRKGIGTGNGVAT